MFCQISCRSMAQLHSWNSPEPALDDAALALKDWLELATVQAENCLIAGDFSAAAEQAEDLLKKGLYVTGSEVLQTHASYVLLQASYELDRLDEAKQFLLQHCGNLTSFEPQVLLLWASLAIDAKTPEPAAETLHSYLQHIMVQEEGADEDQQPGKKKLPCGQITKEQHLAAARLYTVEILTKALDRGTEAESWVRQRQHLTSEEQQELLNELDVQQHVSPQSSQSDMSEIQPALQASHSTSLEPHIHQQSRQQHPALHNRELVAAATQHQSSLYTQNEIQPADGFSSLQLPDCASQNDHGWFAQTQAWATALYNNQGIDIGGTEYSVGQVAGAATLLTVLSCAAVAERKSIRRVARRSMQWVQRSVLDTALAAISFNLNPMTAARSPSYQ